MVENKELMSRYMITKELLTTVKQEIKDRNANIERKYRLKPDKENCLRMAIKKQWDKKKIKKKEQSILFKDMGEAIISAIQKQYTVTDVNTGDGYFIFYMGDYSVVHFHIKEFPGWKFALWFSWDKNEYPGTIKCTWFCQYELWLDKFKPSRSEICEDFRIPIVNFITNIMIDGGITDDYYYEVLENLEYMFKHPYLAMYRDLFGTNFNLKYVTERYAKRKVKKEIRREKHFNKMQDILTQKLLKIVVSEVSKVDGVKEVKPIDRNTDEYTVSPRYQLYITPHDEDHLQELYDYCDELILDVQKKVINKKKYSKYFVFDAVSRDVIIKGANDERL